MILDDFRPGRFLFTVLVVLSLAACGGGGDGGDGGDNGDNGDGGDDDTPPPTAVDCSGSGAVTVSGTVNYEFVPAVARDSGSAFLDYDNSEFRPIRGAEILAVCPDDATQEYDSDVLDENGNYSLSVPQDVDVQLRVRASLQKSGTPGWDVEVVDNTAGQAVWAIAGESFDSGAANLTVNLNAASGWGGSAYTGARTAAPFAILDSVYIAMQKVLAAEDEEFPPLKLNWSPENEACSGTTFPFANGCINTSFFANFGGSVGFNIFILGDADPEGNNINPDTDEYDRHVIVHEWGHYYESAFSRSDSIGGFHASGDELDMRVAFGEGWGYALAAIVTDAPKAVDTSGPGQANGFWFDVEDADDLEDLVNPNPGWWNEASVQEIIYDLYDSTPGEDAAALGFAPIHTVLTGEQKTTEAMTSIFPLIHFLKIDPDNAGDIPHIDAVVVSQDIAEIIDEWGDGRDDGTVLLSNGDDGSEFGHANSISPVHIDLGIVTDGAARNGICTTNALASHDVEENRLGARRFLRFMVDTAGEWEVRLESPAASNDPDFFIYASGEEITDSNLERCFNEPACGVDNSANNEGQEGAGIETAMVPLGTTTQYVIEVMEFLNVDDNDSPADGNICLDLSFDKL